MTRSASPLLPMRTSAEVAAAKERGAPIVALESTIITHGMPYPGNLDMARSVERIIREQGAVPATIAVIDGVLHIGLEDAELEALSKTEGAMKVSRAPKSRRLPSAAMTTVGMGAKIASIELVDLTSEDRARASRTLPSPDGRALKLSLSPLKKLVIRVERKSADSSSTGTSEVFVGEHDGKLWIPVPAPAH